MIASKLIPILYQLIVQPTLANNLKGQVLNVFFDSLPMLQMMKDEAEPFIADVVNQWIPLFIQILQSPAVYSLKHSTLNVKKHTEFN
jgi:hypothetical protein